MSTVFRPLSGNDKHLWAYVADPDTMDELAPGRLRRILERYPWFSTARLLLARASRKPDPLVQLRFMRRPLPDVLLDRPTEVYFLGGETLGVIDRFLARSGESVAGKGDDSDRDEVRPVEIDEELPPVSEELAEIYRAQGLLDRAREAYVQLSLLYPEKSVYFAEQIGRIDASPDEPAPDPVTV